MSPAANGSQHHRTLGNVGLDKQGQLRVPPNMPLSIVAFTRRFLLVQLLKKAPPTPSNRNGSGLFLLAAKEETEAGQ